MKKAIAVMVLILVINLSIPFASGLLLAKTAASSDSVEDREDTKPIGTEVLCVAAQSGNIDKVVTLLSGGADPNGEDRQERKPLYLATTCRKAMPAIVELLLTSGAKINGRDKNEMAPLHNIAHWEEKDPAESLKLMKAFGAEIDIRDHQGMTPLLRADQFGSSLGVMQALLDAGANPGVADNRGNTLLHCVAMNTNTGIDQRLHLVLEVNSDLDTRNQAGFNALELAQKHGNENAVQGLIKAGKKETPPE